MYLLKLFKRFLLILFAMAPTYTMASAHDYVVKKLSNQSSGKEAYYLLQKNIFSESTDCVNYPANQIGKAIQPGKEVIFKIKNSCVWSAIVFDVYKINSNQKIASLTYSCRDGKTTLDIKSECVNNECTFFDLNPLQRAKK